MKVWDLLSYTVPSQELEIWIKPRFGNKFTRYTTDYWDEIRNDDDAMETLKNVTLTTFNTNTYGMIVIHGIEE